MRLRTRGQSGASSVEYGLVVAGIAVALIGSVTAVNAGAGTAYRSQARAMGSVVVVVDEEPVETPSDDPPGEVGNPPSADPTDVPTPTVSPTPGPTAVVSPEPTPVADYTVARGDSVTLDVIPRGMGKTGTPTVSPKGAGSVSWSGARLEFEAADGAQGVVTITYQYKKGSTVYTDTLTVLVVSS